MINIKLICLGKIKETYLSEAIDEYSKRLSKFCKLNILELPDEKLPNNYNQSLIDEVKYKEGRLILNKLENIRSSYIISLDENGKSFSSEEFANTISNICTNISSTIVFIIGGSLGLSKEILNKSDLVMSFSKLTFPHQLFRVFVLEQLFRSFKILNNEKYHH